MTAVVQRPDQQSDTPDTPRRRSRRGTWIVVVAIVVVLGVAVAAVVGFGGDDDTVASEVLPLATAKVTRQTLVDAETSDGELAYGTSRKLAAKASGTVTWLPAAGATVRRGQTLARVDNARVVLLYGTLPTYRTLSSGSQGSDVKQLEQNLKALGYDGFTVDDEYTSATADVVREWKEDLGLDQTGSVAPGQIVYADGEVRVDAVSAETGDSVQPGGLLLDYTGTARVVTVTLDVDDQRLATKGAAVSIKMPDGKRAKGKITKTETVIETTSSNGQSETDTKIEVTIKADDPNAVAGYDRASVDVDFTASQRENVLTVPVSALLALTEGGYGIQVVDGTTTRTVAVKTGLFASGRVEVTGAGIAEGTVVGVAK